MRKFLMRENTTDSIARLRTEVREVFSKNTLTVSFFAETDTHTPKHTEYNAPLWEGDIVEILLTLGNPNIYLEIEVNELSALYAVKIINKDGEGDIKIEKLPEGYCSAQVQTDGKLWRTDVTIFLDKITALGYNKDSAKVNYLRQNFAGETLELYSVSPTMCGSFHKPQAFISI